MTANTDSSTLIEKTLTIETGITDSKLDICISDSGPGISDEELIKIFEPLYSTKVYGIGLGLPIVKQIIERHNGEVDIISKPGQGTSVHLKLPIIQD